MQTRPGGYAWITGHGDAGQNTRAQFCFETFLAGCGTVVMGRNAYDDCGIEHIDGWQEKHFLVASHRPRPADAPPNVEFFCGGLAEKVAEQKRRAQGGIWLFGGGQVASALLRAGLVDEAVIGVLPIILGAGRRLFVGEMPTRPLHLQECTVTDGIAMLRYTNRGRL